MASAATRRSEPLAKRGEAGAHPIWRVGVVVLALAALLCTPRPLSAQPASATGYAAPVAATPMASGSTAPPAGSVPFGASAAGASPYGYPPRPPLGGVWVGPPRGVAYAPAAMPEEIPYQEGMPIPPGYVWEEHAWTGLVVGGAVPFSVLCFFSILIGAGFEDKARTEESKRDSARANGWGGYEQPYGTVGPDDVVWPLALPVVGPFVTIGTAHARAGVITVLLLDGLFEGGTLAMAIAGAVVKKQVLVRQEPGQARVWLTPSLGPAGAGFGVSGELW